MTDTSSYHVQAHGSMAHEHTSVPTFMLEPHGSGSLNIMSAKSQPSSSAWFPKRPSWRRLHQAKKLRLPDLALKIPYGSTPLAEVSPTSVDSPHSRIFEVPNASQIPSLQSASDTVSLTSTTDCSARSSTSSRRAIGGLLGQHWTRSSSRSMSGCRPYADQSPYVHIRSASEDSARSGFSGYQDMDRLVIATAPKPDRTRSNTLGDVSLHTLVNSHNLVMRPKMDFDQRSHSHDNDTMTTSSSRASFISTSRSSFTMSPPSSPTFSHLQPPEQDLATSLGYLVSDCRPVEKSISGNKAPDHRHQDDEGHSHEESPTDPHHGAPDDDDRMVADSIGENIKLNVKIEDTEAGHVDAWEDISRDADYQEEQKLDKIWSFAIEQFPELELANSLPSLRRRSCTRSFLSQIAEVIPDLIMSDTSSAATEACDGMERTPESSSTPDQGRRQSASSQGQRKGKRKSQGEEEEDDFDDSPGGNDGEDDGPGPHKRRTRTARTEPNDTYDFMCPFRLKDPHKFNVRDHKICALKVFRCNMARKEIGINELRRHIKDEHLLDGLERDPRNQCDRCKVFFKTQSEKEGHVKTGTCEYREHPTSRDPLEGIDIATRDRLVSKKGRQGQHPLKQYHGLCQIIFGDETEELPHGHKLVREHFELHTLYNQHQPKLLAKFQTLLQLGPQGMASLGQILQDHSEGLFESCTKGVPYEVADVAPLAEKCDTRQKPPSPDHEGSCDLNMHQSQPQKQRVFDSGIGMSNSIDGSSCESLVKHQEESFNFQTGTPDFVTPDLPGQPTFVSYGQEAPSDEALLGLGAANSVDPAYGATLEQRYHVNPSFLQFDNGRPWLRVTDKDNGKTLRYPIRAPVPVQISTSSTVEPLSGPTPGQVQSSEFTFLSDFIDSTSGFDSFHSSEDSTNSFVMNSHAAQQMQFPNFPPAAHHAAPGGNLNHLHPVYDPSKGGFHRQTSTAQDEFGFPTPAPTYAGTSVSPGAIFQNPPGYI